MIKQIYKYKGHLFQTLAPNDKDIQKGYMWKHCADEQDHLSKFVSTLACNDYVERMK